MNIGIIRNVDKQYLQTLIDESNSFSDVLIKLKVKPVSGNFETLNKRVAEDSLSLTKLIENRKILIKENSLKNGLGIQQYTNDQMFSENSKCGRKHVKNRILNCKLIKYECSVCNLQPTWQNKPLVLVLDHINGVNNDNRLENLRFLCPNCNSQTDTFAGKNTKR